MDEEFLRDFAGKSELTSALRTVRTSGGGGIHAEAASGRDGEIPGGPAGAARGGAPSSREDGDEDGSPAHAAALERDRVAAAARAAAAAGAGHARSSPGRRSFPSSDPVDGPESPSQLSNHAPPGVVDQSPSDLSSAVSTSPGAANSLGLSRRNTHGGSSFTLAAEDNPTPQSVPPPTFGDQGNIGEKHVLVMVGLPARGKTHMAKRLCQYLRFFHGARTQVFNVGSYRRRMMGDAKADSEFFRGNGENDALRKSFARAALKDLVDFLFQEDLGSNLEQRASDSGRVAIFDATNTTRERREWIRSELDGLPLKLLFIESVCTDPDIIDRNIWQVKVNNEDYVTEADKKRAYDDFKKRIENYEAVYQPIDEEHLSFIKLINCGKKVEINNIHGFLCGRIVQFLTNMHATHQTIYLTRHGQSEYNYQGKIGGDSGLSIMGEKYALALAKYCVDHLTRDPRTGEPVPCRLWTSSLQRTILTARHIPHPKVKPTSQTSGFSSKHENKDWIQMSPRVLRNLDEIYAGVCDGMTYEEIEANYPEEFALRNENKLGYRYPRGESYLDVISRLDPLIQELESYQEPVLIVGHQGVLRLIYAYFTGMDRTEACNASIPLNTVIKLTPKTHECDEEREVLYAPTKEDLGAIAEGDERGGGVSPTAADGTNGINPFAANPEPPSY